MKHSFTHAGWLGLCPVYSNPETGDLAARAAWLEPWLTLNLSLFDQLALLAGTPKYSLSFEVHELDRPAIMDIPNAH